ncbi:Trichodiene synthase [Xylariaceae sp. FL0662B]|nr:Trichodiene synthase [Xylariaceae sp. FL0662B]
MDGQSFPLDSFTTALVRFLDAIKYHDDNYEHSKRVETLCDVYRGTAAHFAQPDQRASLKVSECQLGAILRTSVQVSVYCWTKLHPRVLIALSIYWVQIVTLDDSTENPSSAMSSFFPDFACGREQKHPFWRIMSRDLPEFTGYYGSFCAFNILRSTLDYFQGCWVEQYNFHGLPGSHAFPPYLRRLNGLGGICGGSLFPAEDFDEQLLFTQIASIVAEIEQPVALVNDLISFYKEFGNPRDQVSLVQNFVHVEGISLEQAFERVADDAIRSCERLLSLSNGMDPKIKSTVDAFVHGYVTWHFCDRRFRMGEIYENSSGSTGASRFRRYYEEAMEAGDVGFDAWAIPPPEAAPEKRASEFSSSVLS